jgi:hypothetical protein
MPQASGARVDHIRKVDHVLSNGEFSSRRDTKLSRFTRTGSARESLPDVADRPLNQGDESPRQFAAFRYPGRSGRARRSCSRPMHTAYQVFLATVILSLEIPVKSTT